ncbi:unnamed protein product [Meloidogyne enterolobii]|uniref:Uncharacterized protein n=1 Tax=Meloidogyne enterolobii TaxID=390850 RepID=A0ACB0ZU57_MELEN
MPLTMVVGSIIAGMTSEGGGAVAFPVMIFILHTKPHTARDFSIMIQAIGMTMAFFVIIFMRIQIEWRAIIFGTIGAIPGALIGFTLIEPLFNPQTEKMLFVSIWSSFAISLWILNCEKKRKTFNTIENFCFWKCIILILTGFIGAINSQFCIYWRAIIMSEPISQLAYNYIKISYLGFLFTGPPLQLVVPSILIIALGFGFFRLMSNCGKRLLTNKNLENNLKVESERLTKITKKASEERVDI